MTTAEKLLPDAVWAQLPRTSADRRVVGSVLVALLLLVPLIVAGNATGVLVPRLSSEGGESTAHAESHTLDLRADVHNSSARSWRIVGAKLETPSGLFEIDSAPVRIAAHQSRAVSGVVRLVGCATRVLGAGHRAESRNTIRLSVERLLGATTVTIGAAVSDEMIARVCGS